MWGQAGEDPDSGTRGLGWGRSGSSGQGRQSAGGPMGGSPGGGDTRGTASKEGEEQARAIGGQRSPSERCLR